MPSHLAQGQTVQLFGTTFRVKNARGARWAKILWRVDRFWNRPLWLVTFANVDVEATIRTADIIEAVAAALLCYVVTVFVAAL